MATSTFIGKGGVAKIMARGVPTAEVAALKGHSSGYNTTECYVHSGPEHLTRAIKAIDCN